MAATWRNVIFLKKKMVVTIARVIPVDPKIESDSGYRGAVLPYSNSVLFEDGCEIEILTACSVIVTVDGATATVT